MTALSFDELELVVGGNAQPNQIDSVRPPADGSELEYWTPERLREAQPMKIPQLRPRCPVPAAPIASKPCAPGRCCG
jgi:hypothetical protein